MPQLRASFRPEPDRQFRRAGLGLNLDVGGSPDRGERPDDLLGLLVQHVEVVTEDLDHDLRRGAGEGLLHALGQERLDGEAGSRELRERRADLCLGELGRLPRERLQLHVELAVVTAPGVVALFGTPHPLRDHEHMRILE